MNINLHITNTGQGHITGGAYATLVIDIYIEEYLTPEEKRTAIIHEFIEAVLPWLQHDFIDDMAESLSTILEGVEP